MRSIHQIAETIARRNIDPNTPTVEPPEFDPVTFRLEQAEFALAAVVPDRFRQAEVTHPHIQEWVDRFLTREPGCPSLLVVGKPGTGKTHQAFGALRQIAVHAARHRPTVDYRVTSHTHFNHAMRPKSDDSHEHAIDTFIHCDLLIFDDLGAGKQTDWTADSLLRLVDTRWSDNRPTVYTTNLNFAGLEEMVGARAASRVYDSKMARLSGGDRRRGVA